MREDPGLWEDPGDHCAPDTPADPNPPRLSAKLSSIFDSSVSPGASTVPPIPLAEETEYGFNVVRDQAWIIVTGPGDTAEVVASARALIDMG